MAKGNTSKLKSAKTADAVALLEHLNQATSIGIIGVPFEHLLRQRQHLQPKQQYLIVLCQQALEDVALGSVLHLRIAAIRLLVLLLPESKYVIENWLQKHSSQYHYEVHYTLFCYLDWSLELPDTDIIAPQIISLTKNYLQNVSQETARASRMAGDMLGDHWKSVDASSILSELAITARYVAGRSGAVYGLGKLLSERDITPFTRSHIIEVLSRVKNDDRSKELRLMASLTLKAKYAPH